MITTTFEYIKKIETAAFLAGVDSAMAEVERQLPDMLLTAVKKEIEAQRAAPAKRSTRPTYPKRSERKPTLRAVS